MAGNEERRAWVEGWLEVPHIASVTIRSARQSRLPARALVHQRHTHGTSMLMGGNESLPGLTSTAVTRSSSSSASFQSGAMRSPSQQRLLERGSDGAQELPPVRGQIWYDCYLPLRGCGEVFRNPAEWRDHCLRHFRDAGPPRENKCCFCDFTAANGRNDENWRALMDHFEHIHFKLRQRVKRTARPNFHLIQYLWQNNIISEQQWHDLQGCEESRTSAGGRHAAESGQQSSNWTSSTSTPWTETNKNRRRR